MKRNIFRLLFLCAVCGTAAVSCMTDKGNYTYKDPAEVMPVVIEGLKDTVRAAINSTLNISPDLKNADGDYIYKWSAIGIDHERVVTDEIPLSDQRNLDTEVKLEVGTYNLALEVMEPVSGVYVRKVVKLIVQAEIFNDGWYVLKSVDGQTDFDYVNAKGELYSDVLLNVSLTDNARLAGDPVQIVYQGGNYFHQTTNPDGSAKILGDRRVFHVLSTEDVRTFDATTLTLFKTFDAQFYRAPEVCRPQAMYMSQFNTGELYMINDGKLHTVSGGSVNVGKYGAAKMGDHYLHSEMIVPAIDNAWCYDVQSAKFFFANTNRSNLDLLDFQDEGPFGASYELKKLMFGTEMYSAAMGVGIFKEKEAERYHFADLYFDGTSDPYMLMSYHEIEQRYRMPKSDVITAPLAGSFVYFAEGNRLSVYHNADIPEREVLLRELPAGETIVWMKYITKMMLGTDHLIVLSNGASGWTLRDYAVSNVGNPELDDVPETVCSGTGTAHSAILREY